MLSVHGLAVARGGVTALEGVCFTLGRGEALALRGPNGIGKTTLLRTLAGLQPPLAGRVDGADDSVAYAGHLDGVKPTLSVAENLGFWANMFGQRDIGPALAAFDLEALAARPAQTLSAGQKRRLGLARMMVSDRPVWMFDEPTVSLDAGSVARFAQAVQAHCAAGGSAVMATHVELGLPARELDLLPYRPRMDAAGGHPAGDVFDEAIE